MSPRDTPSLQTWMIKNQKSIQHPADCAVVHPGGPYPSLCRGVWGIETALRPLSQRVAPAAVMLAAASSQEERHRLGHPLSPLWGGPLHPGRRPRDVNCGAGRARLLLCLRAVWADVLQCRTPWCTAFVLPHVSSLYPTPALGARYLLLRVRSFSGHPAGLRLAGWLAVRSTRSIELISISSSPSYIVPVHPLVAPPLFFRLAYRLALPLAAPYASTPCRRNGMVHPFYRSYSKTRPASGARRCLRHFSFSLLIPTLSLALSTPLGGCHHCLAPRILPPLVTRPSGGPCPRPSWRAQPHVSRLDYCLVAEPPVWSEASRSDPILTRSLSGNRLTPCGSG